MDRRSAAAAGIRALALALAVLGAPAAMAKAAPQERELGMNVIGNNETPRSLAIVPWKSANPGDLTLQPVRSLLDVPLVPLERDVLLRELHYRSKQQTK